MTLFHVGCGLVSLLAGAAVVGLAKGTAVHRLLGWIYAASMILLCVTSFFIYELFGQFGPFHVAAIVSFVSVLAGLAAPLLRGRIGPVWLEVHYKFMLWSYVGLVMATGSHFFEAVARLIHTHTPLGHTGTFVATAALCWGLPAAVGGTLIYGRKRAILSRVRARSGSPREVA
jgi:uncharacterized membrane protein